MAFVFVAEDGTGLSNANSGASVSFARDEAEGIGLSSLASSGTTSDAAWQAALVAGTRWIESTYTGRFIGDILVDTQSLSCPRQNLEDSEGRVTDGMAIYARACVYAAIHKLQGGSFYTSPSSSNTNVESTSSRVGPIAKTVKYASGGAQIGASMFLADVDGILASILDSSGVSRVLYPEVA